MTTCGNACSLQSPLGVQGVGILNNRALISNCLSSKLHTPLNKRRVRPAAAPAMPLDKPSARPGRACDRTGCESPESCRPTRGQLQDSPSAPKLRSIAAEAAP
jgi:hypothetical protein